jgi:hypothetical protein
MHNDNAMNEIHPIDPKDLLGEHVYHAEELAGSPMPPPNIEPRPGGGSTL